MQLMYYKPYQGKCLILDRDGNRSTTYKIKSFADECEWRYVPDLTETEFNQIIIDEHIMDNFLNDFNKVFTKEKSVSLSFKYSDLKYVLVKNNKDAEQLIHSINDWKENNLIDIDDVYNILPKIIIWDDIKGDL